VVLKNGDRVTGSIIKKDGKNLVIKTDQFGVVTTSWDQVVSIQADKPVNVVLPDGKTVQGTIATTNGKVEITTKDAKLSFEPAEVATNRNDDERKAYERLQKPGWGELWTGTGSVGFAGTSGNARTLTFTTGLNAARITNTDKFAIYFNAIKASAFVSGQNADTAQAVRGGLEYDHNMTPHLFLNTFNDYDLRQVPESGSAVCGRRRPRIPCSQDGAQPSGSARRRRFQLLKFQHSLDPRLGRGVFWGRLQLQAKRRNFVLSGFSNVQRLVKHRLVPHELRCGCFHEDLEVAQLESIVE